MARTLIGNLILRIKAEGLGEGKQVISTMKDIEKAAKRMGRMGVGSWGIGFQKQLDGLKLARKDIDDVQRSWVSLHKSMSSRNLAKAMRSAEISHWKTNTVSELAKGRVEIDRQLKAIETRFRGHFSSMGGIFKAGLVAMGAYTVPYLGGMMVGEGLGASSERRREIFRQKMAGISEGDQNTLFNKSEEISQALPSLPITTIMELSRSAFSTMGDADRAAGVLESMAKSLVVMQSVKGPDAAAQQLIGLIRGLDNLGANADGQIGIDQVNAMVEAATRAAQVDPDFNPADYFNFARRTKVAGPALSQDFLARASVYMQDLGPDTAGNSLGMMFKAFVLEAVGSAGGKKYLEERDRLGIRKNGKLVDREQFGSDPDEWVLKHLIPALKRDGVDMSNDTAIATAVGKLSGNTNATALLTRMITQQEQIQRWLSNKDNAMGLDAAKDVRFEDPFVGWTAFKKSLENLSAALIPIDGINVGLNSLADGINALSKAGEDNPFLTALGMGVGGAAAYKGGKAVLGKMSDMFGLKSSAIALDGSAAALTRAAVALGGQGVMGGLPDGTGPWGDRPGAKNKLGFKENVGRYGYVFALYDLLNNIDIKHFSDEEVNEHRRLLTFAGPREGVAGGDTVPGWKRFLLGDAADPNFSLNEHLRMDHGGKDRPSASVDTTQAEADVQRAKTDMENALNLKGSVDLDTGAVDALIGKLQTALQLIGKLGSAAPVSTSNTGQQMRRNLADYGVAP